MQISDEDIAIMDECVIDMRIINALRVNICSQGRTLHSIRVGGYAEAVKLMTQLLEYQEKMNEAAKISATDN